MESRRTFLLLLFVPSSVLLASCSLEPRTLGGPAAIGTPPKHGMLGVGFGQDGSTVIRYVLPGSTAEQALVAVGDEITAMDRQKVSNKDQFLELMTKTKPGATVDLHLSQGEETRNVQVRLMSAIECANLQAKEQKRKKAQ